MKVCFKAAIELFEEKIAEREKVLDAHIALGNERGIELVEREILRFKDDLENALWLEEKTKNVQVNAT